LKQKKRNSTQQALLRKWLIGDANRHDERDLDAQAKDDPFLADALDGYRSTPEADHAADLTKLKARLRQKTERKRAAGFYLLRIAAVGAVLVAAWLVLQTFQTADKSASVADSMQPTAAESASAPEAPQMMDSVGGNIAQAEKSKMAEPAEPPGARSDISQDVQGKKLDGEKASANQTMNFSTVAAKETAAAPPPVVAEAPPKAAADEAVAIQPSKPDADEDEFAKKESSALNQPAAKRKLEARDQAYKPAAAPGSQAARTITGKVTDENGEPLIGAIVQVANTGIGTNTDVDGSYSLSLPAGTESLVFTYTGYVQLQVEVGTGDQLNVQLAASEASLSEVVVTGYGQADDVEQEVITPRPVGGYKKFRQYVAGKLRHPEADKQPRPREVVKVRFQINADGSLSGFSAKGKAPQAYKDEAIRLLREGPRWESTTGATASYRFVFE
jgi:hypothetical protein